MNPLMHNDHALIDILREKIRASGKIPFADFMATVLYHPAYGYYSSERVKIGKRGDYYTSPLVHPVFGELLCKQIEEMWRLTGGDDFSVIEMGAGNGSLCHDLLMHAREHYPSFYRVLKYILLEESPSMRELQRKRLYPPPSMGGGEVEGEGGEGGIEELPANKVLWIDYSDPLFKEGVTGCFLSNELVDAFPVHLVEKRGGELQEVFVSLRDDTFTEVMDSPSTPEIGEYFHRLGIDLEEGQRGEVNLKAVDWMRWVAKSLKKGFVITIDYGYPAEELYAADRKTGTLLCYHRHRVIEDPFANIGEQDITAHVDFTTLMKVGEEEGLQVAGFTDQTHFLFGLGIGERIEAISRSASTEAEALQERLLIKNLIMPGRMGNVFKILIQYKGIEERPELRGLRPL